MRTKAKELTSFEVYQHADSFFLALHFAHTKCSRQEAGAIGIPICVWSAFSSELFLKCLYHIEKGHLPGGIHLLDRLFAKLTPATQRRLEQLWDEMAIQRKEILDNIDRAEGRARPRDLRSNLAAGADGFRLIRYLYEGKGGNFDFNLSDLPIILRHRILELKPEWARR